LKTNMEKVPITSKRKGATTQQYLDIASIHDDVVVMKDGTLRSVLMVSSINFALKSEEEQDALIIAYANLLNVLDFPIQIIIQSRKLNIDNYLERLKEAEKNQSNELLKVQIGDYRTFVSELVEIGQIMSKKFFVVVPYNPLSNKQKGFFARFKEIIAPAIFVSLRREIFLRRKKDLMSRLNQVVSQLQNMGLAVVPLDTQGLIELYYNSYNPQLSDIQKLTDLNKVQVEE